MRNYGVNDLRKMFLDFFESKNHLVLKSFSLVPHNDNSLLLINSGMAPLKPYFTGQEIPPRNRMATCQKCIRTGDIENVGKTARHGTFFEMLGNFSFGDYFKKEAIEWTWEFLTEVVGLESDRLYPSVYEEDDEAFDLWNTHMKIPTDKIFRFGKKDNFWEHGAGPCGPCSEVYYDRGEKYGCGSSDCTVGCECDRYMEIWNNVFTQFNGDGNNNYVELEKKNIDTGMGLERLAVVVQDVDSIFDVDTIQAIKNKVCEFSKVEYKQDYKKDVSIRLITDHIRSATFMISDGVIPSNEGRGYVLRRLVRRAARHGKLLGITDKFMAKLSETVINESENAYPELADKKSMIFEVLSKEEDSFYKTIDQGLKILNSFITNIEKQNIDILAGEDAFKLHDTYGFPLELTKEILEEKNLKVDEKAFEVAMDEQRKKARDARGETNYMGADATVYEQIDSDIKSNFIGYVDLINQSKIVALTDESQMRDSLSSGDKGTIVVEETVFYPFMGGQSSDNGKILTSDAEFEVVEVIKLPGDKIGHVGFVKKGEFKLKDVVTLSVNEDSRNDIKNNHSATHLLQKALRTVLGDHAHQAGSLVTPDRLRFDFTHFSALSPEEIKKVEEIVNANISGFLPVITKEMSIDEAKNSGAMALFGEKYGDTVRVVSMGDFSVELCGGTHVENTGNISMFKIISESGIAAGVRRIEAITGKGVLKYYENIEEQLISAARLLKSEPSKIDKKIEDMLKEIRTLSSENEKLKSKMAKEALGDVTDSVLEIKGVKVIVNNVDNVDMNELRNLGDDLKNKIGEGVIVLVSGQGSDKVNLIAMATDAAISQGVHAGNLIKEIAGLVGGGGGGRPNMAQAGGKNPSGIDAVLAKAIEVIELQIK